MQSFNRRLSRRIDLCHWQLDHLRAQRGPVAWLHRFWIRWRLRRLERGIEQ